MVVERPDFPGDAVVTDPESFAHLAQQSGKPVLYHPETGTLLLPDPPFVVARTDPKKDWEPDDKEP